MTSNIDDRGLTGLLERVWRSIGPDGEDLGHPDDVSLTGPRAVLPAAFDVTGLAVASVAAANLAAAALLAARNGTPVPAVQVDTRAAAAAFGAEQHLQAVGWTLPPVWDPIAGVYRSRDGWIRLHTNYAVHREAVERVVGADTRDGVATAVLRWDSGELEAAVVAAGGAAAALRDRAGWCASPAGRASRTAVPVEVREFPAGPAARLEPDPRPFGGIRVLDLTRVIAGPVATRFLAGHGADVLRIDPPGFVEVPVLLPETTLGKRCAALDLGSSRGRARFENLVAQADVLVCGLRADAVDRLGYDDEALAALNPGLVVARLNAYGWDGPWRNRRGFDSLVQLSSGLAAAAAAAQGREGPAALPVQALDHATGWLLAAAVARALLRRHAVGAVTRARASLIGTANLLLDLPAPDDAPTPVEPLLQDGPSAWGPIRRVAPAGEIAGLTPHWQVAPGPLGRHPAAWH